MKKLNIKKHWKSEKKLGFHFYFVLVSSIVVLVAVSISSAISEILIKYTHAPSYLISFSLSLVIGIILSIFISKLLITPIKELKELMDKVSNGDLSVVANRRSFIDEVDDMYHYFNLMMNELRATETIQVDFISNVSHEIKTPLNAIDGYTRLLQDDNIFEEERKLYLDKILYNTRRMNELIGNILLLSKVDNKSISYTQEKYSLDEQIRQSILSLESKWNEKNISFELDLDSINYYGNEGLMVHVWNNLIGNAIKYSPNDSIIKISLNKQSNCIIFIVQDSGPGIPENEKKHIFNRFYQIDTSHREEGNGLGLALVKKILDLANGQIEVNNLEPNGCEFRVIL